MLLKICSAKKRDNLLVEAGIFTILGVSFCVMLNAFNFIEIKNKNIGAQSKKIFIPLCSLFLNDEVAVPFALQKTLPHYNGSIVIFDGCWIKVIFYTNYLVYQGL